jgi:hypothetical protein
MREQKLARIRISIATMRVKHVYIPITPALAAAYVAAPAAGFVAIRLETLMMQPVIR